MSFLFFFLPLQDLYGMPLISFGDVRYLEIQVRRNFFYNVDDVLTNFLKRLSNLDILALAPDDYYEVHMIIFPFTC